jgi:hypothetical protein
VALFILWFGVLFLVASVRGKEQMDKLTGLLRDDFTGPNNFFVWSLALGSLAALGYIKQLRQFSNLLLCLVFLVLVLKKKGPNGESLIPSFFSQIRSTERTV